MTWRLITGMSFEHMAEQVHQCRTSWRSYGLCSTSSCHHSLAPLKSSNSGEAMHTLPALHVHILQQPSLCMPAPCPGMASFKVVAHLASANVVSSANHEYYTNHSCMQGVYARSVCKEDPFLVQTRLCSAYPLCLCCLL